MDTLLLICIQMVPLEAYVKKIYIGFIYFGKVKLYRKSENCMTKCDYIRIF